MKDSRTKYTDISQAFNGRASEVEMFCKVSQRTCELLANRLKTVKPKTAAEFENNEYWKDFILKQSKNNEATIELMNYMKGLLIDILEDSKVLMEGAVLRDRLKFQSDTILIQQETIQKQVDEICGRHKANT